MPGSTQVNGKIGFKDFTIPLETFRFDSCDSILCSFCAVGLCGFCCAEESYSLSLPERSPEHDEKAGLVQTHTGMGFHLERDIRLEVPRGQSEPGHHSQVPDGAVCTLDCRKGFFRLAQGGSRLPGPAV
jgi:hypothetical protein